MAKTVVITDDIDGASGAETIVFSFGAQAYEIDLTKKNRTVLEKLLAPYIDAARSSKLPGKTKPPTVTRRRSKSPVDLSAVRAWASENGIAVSGRGRIATAVLDAYQAAH